MAEVIEAVNEPQTLENSYIRSCLDYSKDTAASGYNTIQEYSPAAAALLEGGYNKVQEWTPEFVRTQVETTVNGLDEYVVIADELIEAAIKRKDDFPQLLDDLKSKLTQEELLTYFNNLQFEAGKTFDVTSLLESLPSTRITDGAIQARVAEIVTVVLDQPKVIKDTANKYVDTIHENLDTDQDGIVSVNDVAVTAISVTSMAASYVGSILAYNCAMAESMLTNIMQTTGSEEYVTRISEEISRRVDVQKTFQPLWTALEVLKQVYSQYTSNVTNSTPSYLLDLFTSKSVVSLPGEMIELLKILTGMADHEKGDTVLNETRALFYSLIDISFILEVLKQAEKQPVPNKTVNGMEQVSNQEALKDTKWMKSFQNLNFN